jgi:hypothetical protein
MSRGRSLWLGFASLLAVMGAGTSLALYLSARATTGSSTPGGIDRLLPFAFLSFVTVGVLLAGKRPRNPIGWLFLAAGMLIVINSVAAAYANYGKGVASGRPVGTVAAAWISQWIWGPAIPLLGILVLLFPTGRLLTPRWRFVAWLGIAAILVDTPLRMFNPDELQNLAGVENPVGIGRPGGLFARIAAQQPGSWLVLLASIAAIVSLVLRFRRAKPVERQQLKWFLAAASVLCAGFLVVGLSNGNAVVGWGIWLAGIFALPVATGIAVLRYRLYELDRLVSRALVYVGLTVILGAAYVGLVLGAQAVFSSFAGGSNLAVAVSTLVVAALFLPVRSRVQRFVDRRFYRRRYDAQHTLESFGARLREQVDLDTLSAELQGVVGETMQPAHASVWLRESVS